MYHTVELLHCNMNLLYHRVCIVASIYSVKLCRFFSEKELHGFILQIQSCLWHLTLCKCRTFLEAQETLHHCSQWLTSLNVQLLTVQSPPSVQVWILSIPPVSWILHTVDFGIGSCYWWRSSVFAQCSSQFVFRQLHFELGLWNSRVKT